MTHHIKSEKVETDEYMTITVKEPPDLLVNA